MTALLGGFVNGVAVNLAEPYAPPAASFVMYVTPEPGDPNHIQSDAFSLGFPPCRGGSDETLLFSGRADAAQFVRLCRRLDFIRGRRTSHPDRRVQALPFD